MDIRQTANNYLKRRLYSVQELRMRLLRKGFAKPEVEDFLQEMRTEKILDDARYATMYVESLLLRDVYGRMYIRKKLMERGIATELIASTLEKLYSSEQEKKTALRYFTQKTSQPGLQKLSPEKRLAKVLRSLSTHGFPTEVVYGLAEKNREE